MISAGTWDCVATSGTSLQRLTDCQLSNEIILNSALSITGREDDSTKITAATSKRHFVVGTQTLTIKWLTLITMKQFINLINLINSNFQYRYTLVLNII